MPAERTRELTPHRVSTNTKIAAIVGTGVSALSLLIAVALKPVFQAV